jgi:hypothetical protein
MTEDTNSTSTPTNATQSLSAVDERGDLEGRKVWSYTIPKVKGMNMNKLPDEVRNQTRNFTEHDVGVVGMAGEAGPSTAAYFLLDPSKDRNIGTLVENTLRGYKWWRGNEGSVREQ